MTGGFGASKAILSSQEVYDPETDRWTKINFELDLIWPIHELSTEEKKNYEQLLLISSLISGRYFRVKSMSQAFCRLNNSTIRKRIDGQKYFFALNSIWPIYNFQSMKKFTCKHIYYFYWFQGKIYVTGGFGASKAILSSQEVYDPETDTWTKIISESNLIWPIHELSTQEKKITSKYF